MEIYNCIIVEDEPLAAEILGDYIKQVPFLNLVKVCPDALYALDLLKEKSVDLMFLDIHLPKLKGLDFLESLARPPRVIVTTAYPDYAVQGFEMDVMDYLLKPIRFSRFLKAVNKIHSPQPPQAGDSADGESSVTYFTVGKKKIRIRHCDILYIESIREYARITTTSKSILTKIQMQELEQMLDRNRFLRIHRSFIVSRSMVEAFTATEVEIKGKQIPIGRTYKEDALAKLEGK